VSLSGLLKVWKAIDWKDRDFEKRNHNTDFVRVAELFPMAALPSRFEVFWFKVCFLFAAVAHCVAWLELSGDLRRRRRRSSSPDIVLLFAAFISK